jgi:hypothetical protein
MQDDQILYKAVDRYVSHTEDGLLTISAKIIEICRQHFTAPAKEAPSIPDDMVLIPTVPTKEMVEAWHRAYEHGQWNADSWESAFSLAHKAMIAAAPVIKP